MTVSGLHPHFPNERDTQGTHQGCEEEHSQSTTEKMGVVVTEDERDCVK